MQDLGSGELKPLPAKFFEGVPRDTREFRDRMQQACDEVQPDRTKQGPVFEVGEVLEIRGGRFLLTKIEPGYLKLKSLPKGLTLPGLEVGEADEAEDVLLGFDGD